MNVGKMGVCKTIELVEHKRARMFSANVVATV